MFCKTNCNNNPLKKTGIRKLDSLSTSVFLTHMLVQPDFLWIRKPDSSPHNIISNTMTCSRRQTTLASCCGCLQMAIESGESGPTYLELPSQSFSCSTDINTIWHISSGGSPLGNKRHITEYTSSCHLGHFLDNQVPLEPLNTVQLARAMFCCTEEEEEEWSQYGYLIKYAKVQIMTVSNMTTEICLSAEAEYVALSESLHTAIPMMQLLQ